MREVRFRAKRLDDGRWEYGLLHYSYIECAWLITRSNGWIPTYNDPDTGEETLFIAIDPSTIGQFTGLKDRNGKEIYEGDIVKYFGDSQEIKIHEKTNTESGHGESFHEHIIGFTLSYYGREFDNDKLELIGNIHEK